MDRRRLSVDEIERQTIDDVRALTPEEKFCQMETLFAYGHLFPRTAADEEEDRRADELWTRLRERYGVPPAADVSAAKKDRSEESSALTGAVAASMSGKAAAHG